MPSSSNFYLSKSIYKRYCACQVYYFLTLDSNITPDWLMVNYLFLIIRWPIEKCDEGSIEVSKLISSGVVKIQRHFGKFGFSL